MYDFVSVCGTERVQMGRRPVIDVLRNLMRSLGGAKLPRNYKVLTNPKRE